MACRPLSLPVVSWVLHQTPSHTLQRDTYPYSKSAAADENGVVFRYSPCHINLLKPTGYVMNQQFNIQQLYALPTLYLCVLYLSENKQRLVPLTA